MLEKIINSATNPLYKMSLNALTFNSIVALLPANIKMGILIATGITLNRRGML